MDIGLSHLITVNGEAITAYWDTFNPNLSLGSDHEILVYQHEVGLENIFDEIPNCITKQAYSGEFSLAEKVGTMERFTATYSISFLSGDNGINVKTFVFTSAGVPWAICTLDKAVAIKKDVKTVFFFTSTINVNNKVDLAKNPWDITVDKFNIKYAAKVTSLDNSDPEHFVKFTTDSSLNKESTDNDIRKSLITKGYYRDVPFIFDKGKIGINVTANKADDVVGVKAIFIRILWNMGIMVYVDSVSWGNNTLPHLTLAKGHQLKLVFGINFKEIKNDYTI